MQAKLKREGRRLVEVMTSLQVPCDKATERRPHYIHVAVDQHSQVWQLRATCAVDKESESIRRMGGTSCSTCRIEIRKYLKRKKNWGSDWPKHLRELQLILGSVKRTPYPREEEEPVPMREVLMTKYASRAIGFPVHVKNGLWHSNTLLATFGSVDGKPPRWRFDEEYRFAHELTFSNRCCPLCPRFTRLHSRSRPAHQRGAAHREAGVEAIRRAVKFLNSLGKKKAT